ncbi:hypothetical protein COB64_02960 [Candidatus Wolfebacteria bacterium]|nr:MAG: hypothetical protein COB64_02960 [Candidatus Wolfebacteria bacterium]
MQNDNNKTKFHYWVKTFSSTERARDLYVVLIILLVAFSSFGLGRLSNVTQERESVSIEYIASQNIAAAALTTISATTTETAQQNSTTTGNFVASKNGAKYYFPWCGTVNRIKDENKVWFETREAAEAAGFEKSSTCKGL